MHASLASIGRACTVEDEDPPETPPHNSMDDGLPDQHVTRYGQPLDSCMCPRELVDTSCTLSKSIRFWPVLHKATLNNDSFVNAHLFNTVPLKSDVNTTDKTELISMANTESHATAAKVPGSLNSLTQLHRLCELVRHTVLLESLANTYSELAPGLISLAAHADSMTSKEYDVLETCITSFSRVPLSPLNVAQSVSPNTSRLTGDRLQNPALASSAYPNNNFRTPVTLNVSQLGELRVLCESLRQCLTQVRLVTHEQHTLTCQLDQLASGTYPSHTCEYTVPIQLLKFNTDWLTSSCMVSAHHLVYSGLSLLAHTDLTRFTHGELWEMMRGMEELDILTRHIQTLHQNSQGVTLRRRLIRLLTIPNSFRLTVELLCDPLFVVSPISVGYLFVLIAHQRALRLSHAVYRQLSAIAMCSHRVTQDVPPTSTSANEAKPRLTLVEVFRNYLNEHYDRNTSDYLRAEYEFISGFLDVLSQSTNLLYQVQKLKLVCSAAAAAQAKKTELYRDLHVTIPGKSNFDATVKAGSSHAVSVEGKHGILIRKSSGDQPDGSSVLTSASSTVHTNRRTGVGHTNIMSQYQDTLHRACTFDRYVATGSILCPLNTTDPESSSEVNRIQTSTDVGLTSSNVPTEHSAANPTSKPSVKKAVQWSDYREISTRHQVIGRFLEMVWRYTETLLNNLFLCPPPQAIVGAQASSGLSLQSTQPVLGSVSLVLTNCLQMSTDKLRRLVCHIREVAKSDIFPVGLVPVLKKQALKLDELAHLRCYYTELSELIWHHRMMTSGHMCNLTNAPDVLNTDTGPNGTNRCDSTGSTPVTALGAAECASRTVCALSHVLSSNDTGSLSANRRGLYAPSVRLDVTSLLHLLLSCLHHFASVDPGHLNQLTTRVTQYTKVLDLPSDFESNVIVSNQQQLLASVQSSYDLSRRLCMVTQRLTSSLSVWAMFCTLRLKITMQTLVQHASESTNCTLHDSLRSAIHLMVVHLAEFTRVRSLIDLLQTLVDSLSHNLAQRFPFLNNTALTSRYDGDPRRSKTSTSPGRSDTRPPVRLDFPNWVRTAKLLCSLKHVNHSLVTLLNEMWESECQVHRQFSVLCNKLIGRIFDHSLTAETHQLISTDQIDRFLACLQCDTICTNLQEPNVTTTTESVITTLCQFHQIVYSSVFRLPFDQFCLKWLNRLEEQQKQPSDRESITALLRHHTSSVQHLGCALLARQSFMPVQLITLFCDCDSFRKLQTSTLGPYEVLEQQQQSAHYEDVTQFGEFKPGTQTTDDSSEPRSTVSYTNPTVTNSTRSPLCCVTFDSAASVTPLTVRHRLTDRLNAPGEALAAFAAGVRTSFLLPFKPSDGTQLPVSSHASRLSTTWSALHLPTRSRSASRNKREKNEPS